MIWSNCRDCGAAVQAPFGTLLSTIKCSRCQQIVDLQAQLDHERGRNRDWISSIWRENHGEDGAEEFVARVEALAGRRSLPLLLECLSLHRILQSFETDLKLLQRETEIARSVKATLEGALSEHIRLYGGDDVVFREGERPVSASEMIRRVTRVGWAPADCDPDTLIMEYVADVLGTAVRAVSIRSRKS